MPERMSVFTSELITVWCNPSAQLIEHKIHKPATGEPFRGALTAGVTAMRKHGCTKWLSDDRLNGPLTAEDFQWAEDSWSKEAIGAGWKSWALVLPSEVRAKMDLDKHAKLYRSRGVVVVTFLTDALARDWLSTR